MSRGSMWLRAGAAEGMQCGSIGARDWGPRLFVDQLVHGEPVTGMADAEDTHGILISYPKENAIGGAAGGECQLPDFKAYVFGFPRHGAASGEGLERTDGRCQIRG